LVHSISTHIQVYVSIICCTVRPVYNEHLWDNLLNSEYRGVRFIQYQSKNIFYIWALFKQWWFWIENKITKNSWNHLHPLLKKSFLTCSDCSVIFWISFPQKNSWTQLNNWKQPSLFKLVLYKIPVYSVFGLHRFYCIPLKIVILSYLFSLHKTLSLLVQLYLTLYSSHSSVTLQ
jgi:hypothetical protein